MEGKEQFFCSGSTAYVSGFSGEGCSGLDVYNVTVDSTCTSEGGRVDQTLCGTLPNLDAYIQVTEYANPDCTGPSIGGAAVLPFTCQGGNSNYTYGSCPGGVFTLTTCTDSMCTLNCRDFVPPSCFESETIACPVAATTGAASSAAGSTSSHSDAVSFGVSIVLLSVLLLVQFL